jgi:class 3 adenylate cyclase
MVGRPETKYANTANGHIAYQTFGESGPDLVFITNWITNADTTWDEPSARRYLERLATMGRVILIDKRGTGVSDPHGVGTPLPVEEYVDDIIGVLDEVGSEEATLIGDTEGGFLAMVLAATYPDRFPSLVLINSTARLRRAEDYPIGAPDHVIDSLGDMWKTMYGRSADTLLYTAPSVADDQRFREWWTRFSRQAMPPGVAGDALDWLRQTDVRSVLPAIQADTLVISRRDALLHRPAFGRYLADNIAGARFELLEGTDTLPYHAGDFSPVLDEVEEFITGERKSVTSNRMLATVLFTDIVGSTALASKMGDDRWLDLRSEHDRIIQDHVDRHRGSLVKMTGDGALATFDGPQRAVLCALSIKRELETIGVPIRAGLHTGEVEVRDDELGGLAVHIASRVMDTAETGGILASGTVKDLVFGSPIEFDGCGQFSLKGVEGTWDIFEVRDPQSANTTN